MKINKKYKLWEATEKDSWRPVFEHIFFQDGHAYATDGHILAKVPLDSVFDMEPNLEPSDQIKLLEGRCINANLFKKIYAYGSAWVEKVDDKVQFIIYFEDYPIRIDLKKTEEMHPPKFEAVIAYNGTKEPVDAIGLNHKLLTRLANALGIADKMKLSFTKKSGQIYVEPYEEFYRNTMVGIIMPLNIE